MKIDLLLKNVYVFNSYYKKFIYGNLAILDSKVLYLDKKESENFISTEIINCGGKYLVPGLIDIHMHIESSMITPEAFSNTVKKYGVTTIVSEPHEIANVFGIHGVHSMIEASKNCDIDIFCAIPSSVPSTSAHLETTGGKINFDDMVNLSKMKDVICVGEVMNYTKVIKDDSLEICKFIKYIKDINPNYVIEGHCPRLIGLDLAKFLYLGINGDHTEHTLEEIIERFENGMFVEIQAKLLNKELIDYIKENNLYEHFCFVTDDVMTDTLYFNGHLNNIVKKAISLGMNPKDAIYAATYTSSRRMNLTDRGAIAPGKIADFILIDNPFDFNIIKTFKSGKLIYSEETALNNSKTYSFPTEFYNSVDLNKFSPNDFKIKAPENKSSILCRIMEVNNGGTATKEIFKEIPIKDGYLNIEDTDVLFAFSFERYNKDKSFGFGLVSGDCIKKGAVSTTYAHDSHNLLVVGKNPIDMALSANKVLESNGGISTSYNGEILSHMELSIGGILSSKNALLAAVELRSIKNSLLELGYNHYNPIMSLCTLSLPVSPELKLTNKGLILVKEGTIVSLFK
ncbi:MAG: adenine deaminase C-terminal domain-containing protein [Clostridium sp.]